MKINEKRIFKISLISLAALNLLAFIVYHLTMITFPGSVSAYIFFYFSEIVDFIMPLFIATMLYAAYTVKGQAHALIRAIPYSLTTLLCKFPSYAYDYAYQKIEIDGVMFYSALYSLFDLLVTYLEVTVLFLLIMVVVKIYKNKKEISDTAEIFVCTKPLDLEAPINLGIMASCVAMFIYKLVKEIIDNVTFFKRYIDTYSVEDIVYISFRYIYLLALLILSYIAITLIKNKLLKLKPKKETE